METTLIRCAQRFIGVAEVPGIVHNPLIVGMLQLDAKWVKDDETAWCSAFVNFLCWFLEVPRSRSLAARSWLNIGQTIPIEKAVAGNDIVILKRGTGKQPGPEVINASGHVGFYVAHDEYTITVLGGNQGNTVSIKKFKRSSLLGIRRVG